MVGSNGKFSFGEKRRAKNRRNGYAYGGVLLQLPTPRISGGRQTPDLLNHVELLYV